MRFDFLYSFHYPNSEIPGAVRRLLCSINSIINQNVTVCICNTSKTDIWDRIKHLNNIRYLHVPIDEKLFCKSRTINIGVKNLVHTPYFFLSDIDLVYPPAFIFNFVNKYKTIMQFRPIRVITGVYNIGKTLISNNFNDYITEVNNCNQNKLLRDATRTWFGVAVGNGLVHRDSFFIVRGFDEDLKGYGGEDAIFNDRISLINRYVEDPDINLRTIHIYHKLKYKVDDEACILNQRIWRGRRLYLKNKFSKTNFDIRIHLKDIQANQGLPWGIYG